jgi:hypothetical protein
VPLPQFVIDVPVLGLNVTVEQVFGIVGSVTVGGFFMTTILLLLTVPQAFVTSNVMVYVPGFVNEKEGFTDVGEVPLVK